MDVLRFRGARGETPALFFLAAALIAPVTIFFWPDSHPSIDPFVAQKLDDVLATQRQASSETKAINDSLAAGRADLKMLADQFLALAARVDSLQSTEAKILHDNASLAEELAALTPKVRDEAAATEQAKQQADLDVTKSIQPRTSLAQHGPTEKRRPVFPASPSKPDRKQASKQGAAQPSKPASALTRAEGGN